MQIHNKAPINWHWRRMNLCEGTWCGKLIVVPLHSEQCCTLCKLRFSEQLTFPMFQCCNKIKKSPHNNSHSPVRYLHRARGGRSVEGEGRKRPTCPFGQRNEEQFADRDDGRDDLNLIESSSLRFFSCFLHVGSEVFFSIFKNVF